MHQEDGQNTFERFLSVLDDLGQVTEDLAGLEDQKAAAAAAREHSRLDGYIKKEQAALLQLRGLEQKRSRLAGELGWEGLTFRKILDLAGQEELSGLTPRFHRLDQGVKRLADAKENSDRMIRSRLRELAALTALSQGKGYDASGEAAGPPVSHMKERYI